MRIVDDIFEAVAQGGRTPRLAPGGRGAGGAHPVNKGLAHLPPRLVAFSALLTAPMNSIAAVVQALDP